MNQERQSVESSQTNAIRLPAISLPVAERQGYQQGTTEPDDRRGEPRDSCGVRPAATMSPRRNEPAAQSSNRRDHSCGWESERCCWGLSP